MPYRSVQIESLREIADPQELGSAPAGLRCLTHTTFTKFINAIIVLLHKSRGEKSSRRGHLL